MTYINGNGGPCYYCGEETNPYAGNPGLWPLHFTHADEPGKAKPHHIRCVQVRLAGLEKLLYYPQLQKIINGALRSTIDSHGDITPQQIGSAGKRIHAQIDAFIKDFIKQYTEYPHHGLKENQE